MGRMDELAVRVLLQSSGLGTDDQEQNGEEHVEEEPAKQETLDLRIAAVFVIFAAGMIGGIPPLFLKAFYTPGHPLPRIVRSLGAGIILALALVHIIPEAVEELDALGSLMGKYPYNVGGTCVIFGVLFMVTLESLIHFFIDKRAAAQTRHSQQHVSEGVDATPRLTNSTPQGVMQHDPHTHVCIGRDSRMMLGAAPTSSVRDQVLASLFELGCIFHSFIIGLTLGVNTESKSVVRSLLIALCFHQFLEGIALASFIARALFSRWKSILMVLLYSLTCPIGVAIGIGVSDTYDAESVKAIATQGVFNGVSGGMLLYIALVQLIAEDFSRREIDSAGCSTEKGSSHNHGVDTEKGSSHNHGVDMEKGSGHSDTNDGYQVAGQSGWVLACCHAALFLGAALMSMLAIWA